MAKGKKAFNLECWAIRRKAVAAGWKVPAEKPWRALHAYADKNGIAWPSAGERAAKVDPKAAKRAAHAAAERARRAAKKAAKAAITPQA